MDVIFPNKEVVVMKFGHRLKGLKHLQQRPIDIKFSLEEVYRYLEEFCSPALEDYIIHLRKSLQTFK